jgi:two-component system, cell cycle response regulator
MHGRQVLPGATRAEAAQVVRGLLRELRERSVQGIAEPITASAGVAEFPADAPDVPELVRAADRALYHAKASGRDRVECAANPSEISLAGS